MLETVGGRLSEVAGLVTLLLPGSDFCSIRPVTAVFSNNPSHAALMVQILVG